MANYEKRENGTWSVRFRVIDFDGKTTMKRLSGFAKKNQAELAYRTFVSDHENNLHFSQKPLESLTFDMLLEKYFESKQHQVKESSLYDMQNVIGARILPFFTSMLVSEIKPSHVTAWQNSLNEAGYSYKYKKSLRTYLSGIFSFAMKNFDLLQNPVDKSEKFRNLDGKSEMMFWTLEEFKKFYEHVDDLIYQTFFHCLYFGGFRKGELLAIAPGDIDFEKSTITISKSLTRKVAGKNYAITTPKNQTSNRIVAMPTSSMKLLDQLVSKRKKSTFVFGDDSPLAENTLTRKFKRYCANAQVKEIRIHDLRHSHASLLIEQGENILLIAKRLGHSDITQTLNTYSHLMPDKETELIARLDKLL